MAKIRVRTPSPTGLLYESDETLRRAARAPYVVPSFTIRNLLAELIERREREVADRSRYGP